MQALVAGLLGYGRDETTQSPCIPFLGTDPVPRQRQQARTRAWSCWTCTRSPRTRRALGSASTKHPKLDTNPSGRPLRPGRVARADYSYDRRGTCNRFLPSAPPADCAHVPRELVDVHFPKARQIVLVCDHFHTGTLPKSLYKACDQETDARLAARPGGTALHPTPRPPGIRAHPCLHRRFAEQKVLAAETAAGWPLPQPTRQARPRALADRRLPHPAAPPVSIILGVQRNFER